MKAKVYLHIGHPKTGSSAFQACLAKSHEALAASGILYPYHRSFSHASRNHISSGNLSIGHVNENWLSGGILPILKANPEYNTFIFSNENLIHRLSDFTSCLESLRDQWDFHVLLVVRNPIEQLGSVYQQLVKRHGYSKGYEEFLFEHEYRCNASIKSAAALEMLEAHGISYTLFNYSVLKDKIIEALIDSMGIDAGIARHSITAPVNRSLSATELQLLLFVNALYGSSVGRRLADSLVNQLPDVEAVSLTMSAGSWQRVVEVNQLSVDTINKRLTSENQLCFTAQPGFSGNLYCNLSANQIQLSRTVLAESIQQELGFNLNEPTNIDIERSFIDAWRFQAARLTSLTSRVLCASQRMKVIKSQDQPKI
jgi:hypothetical protein